MTRRLLTYAAWAILAWAGLIAVAAAVVALALAVGPTLWLLAVMGSVLIGAVVLMEREAAAKQHRAESARKYRRAVALRGRR